MVAGVGVLFGGRRQNRRRRGQTHVAPSVYFRSLGIKELRF